MGGGGGGESGRGKGRQQGGKEGALHMMRKEKGREQRGEASEGHGGGVEKMQRPGELQEGTALHCRQQVACARHHPGMGPRTHP